MKKQFRVTTVFAYADGTQSTTSITKPYRKTAEDQAKHTAKWLEAHGRTLINTTIEEVTE